MAFQTNVLRDGEWITETVNIQSALRQQAIAAAAAGESVDQDPKPSSFGLLSRTVVQSPMVQRVLPVRLRSKLHNDIAFIGDRFVQIRQLHTDGRLQEIAHKKDFKSRIRSAAVLGDSVEHGLDDETPGGSAKSESDASAMMVDAPSDLTDTESRLLPPQLLVLMLESHDTVFLFLTERPGCPVQFVSSSSALPRSVPYLGLHLAVDPTSRYMATASPEGVLVMFELEDSKTLDSQYAACGCIRPIKSFRIRLFQGVIHQLEFLHPRPEDDYHIILIVIVIRRERARGNPVTRMIIYEWEVGDSLKEVFASDRSGSRLPQEHNLPLFLIPLRFNTAFFTVSEKSIGIVKDCLSGSPVFESLGADPPSQTALHHGARLPLWTAWARPFRRQKYFEKTDIIYLAREDGAIIHIEIEAGGLVPFITNVGCIDANIDLAFTAAYDVYSDILIIGGGSGPGGIWKLAPRTELEQVSVLPSWSPVVDMAVVGSCFRPLPVPDAVFTASGRGSKGSVTQWRWGLQGRISLDIDSGEPVRRSWAFYADAGLGRVNLCAVLAFPDSSAFIQFSEDFGQVEATATQDTHFDLATRTLDVCRSLQGIFIQVTERAVALTCGLKSDSAGRRYPLEEILAMDNVVAGNASCSDDTIAVSSYRDRRFLLHILRVQQTSLERCFTWEVPGDLTSVLLFEAAGSKYVIAGTVLDFVPWIFLYTLAGEIVGDKAIRPLNQAAEDESLQYESITGICRVHEAAGEVYLAAGTRCGHFVMMRIVPQEAIPIILTTESMGVTPVDVFPAPRSFRGTAAVFACCDSNLVMMDDFSPQEKRFLAKHHVWLTDASDGSMPSPAVHSVCSLPSPSSGSSGHISLLAQAGSKLLVANIWPDIGLVPRSIPLEGTPTRLLYSQSWKCLIVALLKGNRPTLAFIDPESGGSIACPTDREGKVTDFITGLGHEGDRILGLCEWTCIKNGSTYVFVLVATKDGRLLVISTASTKAHGPLKRLRYYTQYKRMYKRPIYSVVGDDQGILYCIDKTIRWDVLDLKDRKLKLKSEHELDSPATMLHVAGGHVYALTTRHSVQVIDYKSKRSSGMVVAYSDRVSRSTIHMIEAGSGSDASPPVILLSDQDGGIAGIRIPWRQQRKEFDFVFKTTLPTSVRRFVKARSRPLWLAAGCGDSRPCADQDDGVEVLGVSLDGCMRHFATLHLDLWRFLCLVQIVVRKSNNLSAGSTIAGSGRGAGAEEANRMDLEAELESRQRSKRMHIDGDVLERCLRPRCLGDMFCNGGCFALFCGYLDNLEGGRHTRQLWDAQMTDEERRQQYLQVGYDILDRVLHAVL
ncbi:thermotolerance protein [Ophiocordyceps camponoti-floridani]|uniref:Thermotolerance protein n=1 Tax=Ophiocordyceps camponoti-floridani TaxID=2030778 RepID=A0A8H4VDC6_9HYPO|nr:thermotolerance protein [Ophiocordyceps camponoti-floridani]